MKKSMYMKWLLLSIFLIIVDVYTKNLVRVHCMIGESYNVFPGMNFCYVNNSGLAFGLFSSVGFYFQWLFTIIIVLLIIFFLFSLYKSISANLLIDSFSYSMVIGGSVGNLYDRIFYGSVVDFIDFYIKNWHWPVFNIADIGIFLGLFLLCLKQNFSFKTLFNFNIK